MSQSKLALPEINPICTAANATTTSIGIEMLRLLNNKTKRDEHIRSPNKFKLPKTYLPSSKIVTAPHLQFRSLVLFQEYEGVLKGSYRACEATE